jgi:hypothetical protein
VWCVGLWLSSRILIEFSSWLFFNFSDIPTVSHSKLIFQSHIILSFWLDINHPVDIESQWLLSHNHSYFRACKIQFRGNDTKCTAHTGGPVEEQLITIDCDPCPSCACQWVWQYHFPVGLSSDTVHATKYQIKCQTEFNITRICNTSLALQLGFKCIACNSNFASRSAANSHHRHRVAQGTQCADPKSLKSQSITARIDLSTGILHAAGPISQITCTRALAIEKWI